MNGYREYPEETVTLLTIIISAQQAGFSLDEIMQILPSNTSNWEHDKLVSMLNKKIADIESLEKKLKNSKAQLKEVLRAIEEKPLEIACSDNAERVIKKIKGKKQSK